MLLLLLKSVCLNKLVVLLRLYGEIVECNEECIEVCIGAVCHCLNVIGESIYTLYGAVCGGGGNSETVVELVAAEGYSYGALTVCNAVYNAVCYAVTVRVPV